MMGPENRLNASFVNETTLTFGRSESIGIYNLNNNQLKFNYIPSETLDNRSVACLTCHRNASIVAAGDTHDSRILLYEFPKFTCISQLKSKSNHQEISSKLYWNIASVFFSEMCSLDPTVAGYYKKLLFHLTEHLIALKFSSNNFIELWNWRSGSLLFVQQTDYFVDEQTILWEAHKTREHFSLFF